jgi:hypothetical protein
MEAGMLVKEFRHPECLENETWIGNTTKDGFETINYVSKRLGLVAYRSDGTPIPAEQELFPLFVARQEFREKTTRLIPVGPENTELWLQFCICLRKNFANAMTGCRTNAPCYKN